MTWSGRKLTGLTLTDNAAVTYSYNSDGIRTEKTAGTRHTEYLLDGTKVLKQITTDISDNDYYEQILFYYDVNEELVGFSYLGHDYWYGKDTNGVIRYIYNEYGEICAEYTYDAWGRIISSSNLNGGTVANVNPFRYKSYYYDTETGFYYLQSRYYDPTVARFISADSTDYLGASGSVLSYNLFCYCENEPIFYCDSTGEFVITSTILICAGIGALIVGTIGGIGGYHLSKKWNIPKEKRWKYILGGVVIGTSVGALLGGTIGYIIGPTASSGIVLWSGNGNASVFQAAKSFAKKNGLRVLETTRKGKMLTKMQNKLIAEYGKEIAWEIMKPLFDAASEQFARSASGVVHIFLNVDGIRFESTFLTIEYWILKEMGINMVFHFIK